MQNNNKFQIDLLKINYEPFLDKYLIIYPRKEHSIRILDDVTLRILKLIDRGYNVKELSEHLSKKHAISFQAAKKEIEKFVKKLSQLEAISPRQEDRSRLVIRKNKKTEEGLSCPFKAHIALTNECNLKCKHCYNIKKEDELKKEEWYKVLDILDNWGVLKLQVSGGEPLCHPEFKEIIKYAAAKKFSLMLFTNATLIENKAIARFIAKYFSSVQINLDGTKEFHNSFRGDSFAFQNTIRGIKFLLKEKANVIVGMSAGTENLNMIEGVYKLCQELGVRKFRVSPFALEGRGEQYNFRVSEYIKIWKKILYFLGKRRRKEKTEVLLPPDSPIKLPRHYRLCSAAKSLIYISANGDIYPCPLLSFEEFKSGNILSGNVSEIWSRSPVFKLLRNLRIEECESCKIKCLYWCRGVVYGLTKKINALPPYCPRCWAKYETS